MVKDRFDRLLVLLLFTAIIALAVLLAVDAPRGGPHGSGLDKAMEREMAYQARVSLLQKLYGPVESLRQTGNLQAALLKLDELARKYPGEAHGYILQGEILRETGALAEAVASYVEGVRLNGEYVDGKSPLSRRKEIRQLVDEGLKDIGVRAKSHPENRSLAATLKKTYYLQSRLAGGCE
ncbi:MAG: hypothetical protein FD174_881 [Geobacteraceae bacterium]|nr:MAG: hypothetical protein FD174_881 [Geobacteraceae bacterium]